MAGSAASLCKWIIVSFVAQLNICVSDNDARKVFKPGKNRDGYFTKEDILAQATRAKDVLSRDYPNESHVFAYGNATTSKASGYGVVCGEANAESNQQAALHSSQQG
jgi:hypothetical protein